MKLHTSTLALCAVTLACASAVAVHAQSDEGVRQYKAKDNVKSLHNVARIGGVNRITTTDTDELQDYGIGVAVPGVVLLVLFFIMCFATCCAKKCCNPDKCDDKLAVAIFAAFGIASCIAWFVAIGGNAETSDGLRSFQSVTGKLIGIIDDFDKFSADIGKVSKELESDTEAANATCSSLEEIGVSFPFDEITGGLVEILDVFGDSVNSILGPLDDVKSTLQDVNDNMDAAIEQRELAVYLLVVVFLVLTAIFVGSTTLRIIGKTPESLDPPINCMSKYSSRIIFTIGLFIMFLIVVVTVVLSILSFVMADLCAPNINHNLNELLFSAQASTKYEAWKEADGDPAGLCSEPTFTNGPGEATCFLQECPEDNFLSEGFDKARDGLGQSEQAISTFQQNLDAALDSAPEGYNVTDCPEDVSDLADNLNDNLDGLVTQAEELVDCVDTMNDFYATIFYDGFCGSALNGLILTWISMIFAIFSLLAAMCVFRTRDFEQIAEDRRVAPRSKDGTAASNLAGVSYADGNKQDPY